MYPPGVGVGGDHGAGVRRHHQVHVDRKVKVVRLSELISVLRLPPNAEACPMVSRSGCLLCSYISKIVPLLLQAAIRALCRRT